MSKIIQLALAVGEPAGAASRVSLAEARALAHRPKSPGSRRSALRPAGKRSAHSTCPSWPPTSRVSTVESATSSRFRRRTTRPTASLAGCCPWTEPQVDLENAAGADAALAWALRRAGRSRQDVALLGRSPRPGRSGCR
jgi:hypothetical protein